MRRILAIFLAIFLGLAAAGPAGAAVYDYQFFGNANGAITNLAGDVTLLDFPDGADFRIHLIADTALADTTDPTLTLLPASSAWIDLAGWGRSYFTDPMTLFLSTDVTDPANVFSLVGFAPAGGDALVADFTAFMPYDLLSPLGPRLLPLVLPLGGAQIGPDMLLALESITGDGVTESVNFEVPEPGSLLLLGSGLLGVAAFRRRRAV